MKTKKVPLVVKHPRLIHIYMMFVVLTGFLLGLQAYLMARHIIFIPLMILIPYVIHKFAQFWYRKYLEKKKWALYFREIFIGLHFVPLILQVLTIIHPGIDNIILGIIGIFLFEASS